VHEFGLCQSILTAVEGRAAGRRVTGVRVRIGALHRVFDEAFDQAFSLMSEGTVADGAEVDLVVVPVQATCRACGEVTVSQDQVVACPQCGSLELDRQGGDELVLESLVLEGPAESEATG
jgi:hydrogenase nickel incorporation protein HypA/HybF